MRGGNGSWAMLYGANPVSDTTIELAVDEDQLLDAERSHSPEQVAYLLVSPADADRDGDGDVDGRDLAAYIADPAGISLAAFAGVFGSVASQPANQAPVLVPIGDKDATETQLVDLYCKRVRYGRTGAACLNRRRLAGECELYRQRQW